MIRLIIVGCHKVIHIYRSKTDGVVVVVQQMTCPVIQLSLSLFVVHHVCVETTLHLKKLDHTNDE